MTPEMYIFGSSLPNAEICVLGFDATLTFPFVILGDNFLQKNTVIFDKEKNRMGFVAREKIRIYGYLADWIRYFINLVEIALFFGGLSIIREVKINE